MRVHYVNVSQNAKTGPIPASIVERASCWDGCAFYEHGCYAETGALAIHWDRLSRGLVSGSWSELCANVARLRPGRLWRYAQAGDLPGPRMLRASFAVPRIAGRLRYAVPHRRRFRQPPTAGATPAALGRPFEELRR